MSTGKLPFKAPAPRTHDSVLEDLKKHPEKHKHDHAKLIACCFIDGAVDLALIDAHSKHVDLGTNGGVRCDVVSGPCACGAWH